MTNKHLLITFSLIILFVLSTSFINMYLFVLVFVAVFSAIFLLHKVFNGAPFVRTFHCDIESMLQLSEIQITENFIDLGSGFGDIVEAFAPCCANSHGVEIHPMLFLLAKSSSKKSNVRFFYKNLWSMDLSVYDVVSVFGVPQMMPELEKKLLTELKPGSRVLSNRFMFPGWQFEKQSGDIYLYVKS